MRIPPTAMPSRRTWRRLDPGPWRRDDPLMDFRQLERSLAVVDHGGFHRAAQALYVAQPSLSQSTKQVEHELSDTLFHRVGRGVGADGGGPGSRQTGAGRRPRPSSPSRRCRGCGPDGWRSRRCRPRPSPPLATVVSRFTAEYPRRAGGGPRRRHGRSGGGGRAYRPAGARSLGLIRRSIWRSPSRVTRAGSIARRVSSWIWHSAGNADRWGGKQIFDRAARWLLESMS